MNVRRIASFLLLSGAGLVSAEPFLGSWKFNEKSSTCSENPKLAPDHWTITSDGGKLVVRVSRPNEPAGDGRTQTWHLDGEFREGRVVYRGPRSSTYDRFSTKRADEKTVEETYRMGDKLVGRARLQVSADGKVLIVERQTATDSGGVHRDHFVYDRQ